MANGNRLFALAEREFKKKRELPAPAKFKGYRINVNKFDETWDRRRGTAARMMSVVLRDDDHTLLERVCESPQASKAYADAAEWLRRESAYLRRTASLLDTAVSRLTTVLQRCRSEQQGVQS